MKKSLLIGIVSLAASAVSTFAQGTIFLDNYNNAGGLINYGASGIPANGTSGSFGTSGTGLLAGWTVGLYFVVGTPTITDPAGNTIPDASLAFATGASSTAALFTTAFSSAGQFSAAGAWVVPGTLAAGGQSVTAEIVAWNTSGGSYANAGWRGHSNPFVITTSSSSSPAPNAVGPLFSSFGVTQVSAVPEPSTLALAGLGGFGMLLAMRRKKA